MEYALLVSFAAPVASADAKLFLSGAPERNQRAPRGGWRGCKSGLQPPLDSPRHQSFLRAGGVFRL